MRQLSLADRGQTVSLDKSLDEGTPTCLGVARLGSLQTAGSSFTVWMQVRGSSWVEAKEGVPAAGAGGPQRVVRGPEPEHRSAAGADRDGRLWPVCRSWPPEPQRRPGGPAAVARCAGQWPAGPCTEAAAAASGKPAAGPGRERAALPGALAQPQAAGVRAHAARKAVPGGQQPSRGAHR
ncbi:hypothetical protein G6F35_015438 [Rhizopus arrhizus]|nr:hypothetical protein G6F35_015438 [Rhizopus arrhizus]